MIRPAWAVWPTVAAAAVAAPWLIDSYGVAMLARILVLGLVAVSIALLTGVTGLPTLGQTGPFAAGAYACVVFGAGPGAEPVGVVQLAVGAAAGALFGLFTAPLLVPARGVVFLMITLAIGELVTITAGRWKPVTGGTDGLYGLPAVRPVWGAPPLADDRARYLYGLAVTAFVVGALALVLRSPAGLLLRACRDDEARLRASGHPVAGYVLAALVAAGTVAGVAGSLLVATQQYVSPADFAFDTAALLLLAVVIGGASAAGVAGSRWRPGPLGGAILGTALVIAVRDWLSGVWPGQAPLLLGAAFVVAAYLFPGALPALRRKPLPREPLPRRPLPGGAR